MCGKNSLEKNCDFILAKRKPKSVYCKKEESDTIEKRITQFDVCRDLHFMRAKNFTNSSGLIGYSSGFHRAQDDLESLCKYIIKYLKYGNTDCRVFKGGIQNWKDFCLKINIPKENY